MTQHPDETFDAAFLDGPQDDQPTQLLMQEMSVEWEKEGGITSCETTHRARLF